MNDAIEETISNYVAAWNALDISALGHAWDATASEIHYVAEEMETPFTELEKVRNYWHMTAAIVQRVRMTISDQRINSLTDEICVVTYAMHMDADLQAGNSGTGLSIGVDVRVSAILRFNGADWKFIHYVEAPLGALPFVRKAYSANYRRER